jgi:pyridinium-3,5-biscarboxylic acid mononucleotide sulfurtransferase
VIADAPAAARLATLEANLEGFDQLAVAVSGGVDSLTLAAAAHGRLGARAAMFHAVSPAVPPEATERTRNLAARYGWRLEVIDAGEFSDPDYLRNPANRCFYCKTNLYAAIASRTASSIVSGTNQDDLGDFRPGLEAAANHGVRHPYVECGIDKSTVRAIATLLGLGGVAELPAAPCLSSRLETGIHVTPGALGLVHAVERLVARNLAASTVRCRIRGAGVYVELDERSFERAITAESGLRQQVEAICAARGRPGAVEFAPYRMGSAFLRD